MNLQVTIATTYVMCVTISCVLCSPIARLTTNEHSDNGDNNNFGMMQTSFKSIENARKFLRNWFRSLTIRQSNIDQSESRTKRSAAENGVVVLDIHDSNETSFEDYERQYLLHQTINYLKQLFFSSQYQENLKNQNALNQGAHSQHPGIGTTTMNPAADFNRMDPILEAEIDQLMDLSADELLKMFNNVQHAAQHGGGNTDITSLCCNMG